MYLSFEGDPEDKTLRVSERKILIPQLIRERARKVKCVEEVAAFQQCAKDNGLLVTFNCRQPTEKLKECLAYWFHDAEFNNECKQIYLEQRTEYRTTGVSKKQKERQAAAEAAAANDFA